MKETDLPPTDYENLEETLRQRLIIEIFHNMGLISDQVYFTKYTNNAETFDRDYKIWLEMKKSDIDSKGVLQNE